MRNTLKMIKTGLVVLFLSATTVAIGQTGAVGSIDKSPIPVFLGSSTSSGDPGRVAALTTRDGVSLEDENQDVVLFYNPATSGPSLRLVASKTEDHATRTGNDALAFTMYKWYYMGQNPTLPSATAYGSPEIIPAIGLEQKVGTTTDANKLDITGLTEGFHIFKVEGYIVPQGADEDEICQPNHEEFFIVYVLPRLDVSVARDGGAGTPLQYCETDAGSQNKVVLKADVAYDGYIGTPAVGDFELKYTWYAVKADAVTGDYPTIDVTKADITGASLQVAHTVTGATDGFTPDIAEIGKYKFFVEVEYTIKARDYDVAETSTARKRTYALYRTWFGGNTQADASVIFVTPAPGKPHITIEGVTD